LPPDGEIMCFENYPNNVYYVKDIELPTRQIYTLKMDSIFNVLDLASLNPSSAIVNSQPFTLSVNGHGFDSLSTVYFNDTSKTTTYVSDSVLTAEISTSDISVVGNYPVWVTDEWGTSDTLTFVVTPFPIVLNSISPGLTFTPSVLDFSNEYPEFTVTVFGEFFTDSSVVYFNGSIKETTFLTDTVITFQLEENDMPYAGNYPVWVSNYGSVSDTLFFTVADTLPQSIIPVCNCIENERTAYYGYINNNNTTIYIPISSINYFTPQVPGPAPEYMDKGQPTIFLEGTHNNVFFIDAYQYFDVWILDKESAVPDPRLPACE
jgi:hypothetical protein